MLCLAACQPAAKQGHPDTPVSAQPDSVGISQWTNSLGKPEQSAEANAPPWFTKSPWFNAWRAEEAENFKRFPNQASRSGDDLTISFDGKPTARFSDVDKAECEGNGTCSLWQFAGLITLQSIAGKEETFAVIEHNNGEQNSNLLINARGDNHWVGDTFQVSPNHRFLIVGEQESIMSDGYLEIIDFASPGHASVANFDAQCDPETWDRVAAQVVCSRGDTNSVEVSGTVEPLPSGQWRLRETKVRKNNDNVPVELRTQTVSLSAVSHSADPAANAAYEHRIGLRRLTD